MDEHLSRPLLTRVLALCVPPAILLIAVIGVTGYFTISHYMNTAIERNVRIRSAVIARSVEGFLENRIRDITYLRQGRINRESLLEFMHRQARLDPTLYREAAFISESPSSSVLFVMAEGVVRQIAPEDFSDVRPNPMLFSSDLPALEAEEIFCTTIMLTDFPFPSKTGIGNREESSMFRVVTPYFEPGMPPGYLMLGVDAKHLRNKLSQVYTAKDPAWGFEHSNEVRLSYLFDSEGWMLFQSESPDDTQNKLSTNLARAGLLGTLGKAGLASAFLPDKGNTTYWQTVNSVQKKEGGLLRINSDLGLHNILASSSYYIAFEPIMYQGKTGENPRLFAGMVYIDRSNLAFTASKAAIVMSLVWFCGALFLLALFILTMRGLFIQPLQTLQQSIVTRLRSGDNQPVSVSGGCSELRELAVATSEVFRTLDLCASKLELLSEDPMSEKMQQPIDLTDNYQSSITEDNFFSDIIGSSAGQIELKSQVLKAARTNVDILIIGETGTGKQLVAEAIHKHSTLRNGPFVAINCGALNEELLLDTLFGHVKGAHSEAKSDRKGAFVESIGGTLFLDEIQSASLNLQQSLLRAISERKIRPLGSDTEIDVDLRLVTAANKDLTQLIKDGLFREDLFYRLHVLTIYTLPLRYHKEDIPLLAHHYLKQTKEFVEKPNLKFSKGAIKKLLSHDWPGNVRELVNCITRTVVFAESPVIQADDLRMGDPEMYMKGSAPLQFKETNTAKIIDSQPDAPLGRNSQNSNALLPETYEHAPLTLVLSPRQSKALPLILQGKVFTRKEYQGIVDTRLPGRTANYDLNDMIQKGILSKEGAGSNTRYKLDPGADLNALKTLESGVHA